MARPQKPIDWASFDSEVFARSVLTDIWGSDTFPKFVDPIKKVRRIVQLLEPEEKRFWYGSPFYPIKQASLESRLSSAVASWVKKYNVERQSPFEFCGFSISELMEHVESQFEPWMTWENWGAWHIDHIIPRCRYGKPYLRDEVFGLGNLRPISRSENIHKGSRYDG